MSFQNLYVKGSLHIISQMHWLTIAKAVKSLFTDKINNRSKIALIEKKKISAKGETLVEFAFVARLKIILKTYILNTNAAFPKVIVNNTAI